MGKQSPRPMIFYPLFLEDI